MIFKVRLNRSRYGRVDVFWYSQNSTKCHLSGLIKHLHTHELRCWFLTHIQIRAIYPKSFNTPLINIYYCFNVTKDTHKSTSSIWEKYEKFDWSCMDGNDPSTRRRKIIIIFSLYDILSYVHSSNPLTTDEWMELKRVDLLTEGEFLWRGAWYVTITDIY